MPESEDAHVNGEPDLGDLLSPVQTQNVTHAPSDIDTRFGVEEMDFGGMKEVNDLRGGYENDALNAMHDSFEAPPSTNEIFSPSDFEPLDSRLAS